MASISLEARDKLVALYIGMFNAAPGAANLSTMVQAYEGGKTLKQIAEDFDNADFRKQYPAFLTAEEFADRLVNRFLGSEAGAAQKTWATNWIITKLGNGVSDTDIIVEAVNALLATNNPAYDGSKAALNNKVTVANYYSVTLEQSGDSLAALQAVISGVTSDATTVDTAKANADAIKDAAEAVVLTLTTGADTTLLGGAGNDTYVAAVGSGGSIANGTTLGAGDNLKGGEGTDTLSVAISGSAGAPVTIAAVSMSGVEKIDVSNYDVDTTSQANTHTIDLSQATGVTSINLTGSSVNGDTLFTNIGAIADASMANGSGDLGLTYTGAANSSLTDEQNLTLDSVTAATFTANGITSLNINSNSGNAITGNSLTIGAGSSFSTINVTGSTGLTLTESQTNALKVVDASAFTGKLSLTTNDVTDVKFTGGSAADTFVVGGTLTAADTIDGGDGVDTLSTSVAVTDAILANVSNVETLTITGGTTVTLAKDSSVTTINANDAGADTITLNDGLTNAMTVMLGAGDKVDNSSAKTSLTVTTSGTALGTASVVGGTGTDALTITADNKTVVFTNITGVDTVTVADNFFGAGSDLILNLGAYATALTIDATSLDSGTGFPLVNDETLTVDGSTATKALTITSGGGADTLTGGSANDVIDGGAGNDSINGTAGGDDSISGGAGNDTINMGAAMTAADTIDGGEGTDTLSVTSLSAAALANVSNIEVLSLSGAASAATLTANLSFTSIDMASVDNNAQTLTLSTGYTNATTVSIDAGDKVVNSAGVAMTVSATAADLEVGDATTITGGAGADTLSVKADNSTVATSGLITGVETITVVDGGDATTGVVTAGKDITIDLSGYATALTIDASALDAPSDFFGTNDEKLIITGTAATKALTITGGGSNDTFIGSSDALTGDNLSGGAGNDTFSMAGNLTNVDTLDGGAGFDTLTVSGAVIDTQFINTSGIETLTLAAGATLAGFFDTAGFTTVNVASNQQVDAQGTTTGHTFVLNAADAVDTVLGGFGDDTISIAGTAQLKADDVINAGLGNDTIRLNNAAGAVTAAVTLSSSLVTGVENFTVFNANGGDKAGSENADLLSLTFDKASSVAVATTINVDGSVVTDSNDGFTVDASAVTDTDFKFNVTTGAGADVLKGGASTDTLSGGAGNDTITGGLGADVLTGGAGNDSFVYAVDKAMTNLPSNNANADTITDFTKLNDSIDITLTTSGNVNAKYVGAAASNAEALSLLSSKSGEFFFNTTTKQLVMDVNGDGLLQANDLYITLTGLEDLTATTVNVTLVSDGGSITVTATTGNDVFDVTGASDFNVDGLAGNDTFNATQATLTTADTLVGGAGTDTLNIAGTGATALTTDANIATIEVINLTGSAAQQLNLSTQSEAFTINMGNNSSTVTLTAIGSNTVAGGTGTDTIILAADAAGLGDAGFANLTSVEALTLAGGGTDNVTIGTNAAAAGIATITTGAGATTISSAYTTAFSLVGDALTDGTALTLTGAGTGPATVSLVAGDLNASAYAGTAVVVNATTGTNVITTGGGADTIAAGTGDDVITAGAGDDAIDAGAGADTVIGGAGVDSISLGAADGNADVVSLDGINSAADADFIFDFATGSDKIELTNTAGVGAGSPAGALVNIAGIGGLTIDDIVVDTAANLGANAVNVGNQSGTFTSGGYAYASDTGALYFDADGDFTAGVVLVGNLYSTSAGGANTAVVLATGDISWA